VESAMVRHHYGPWDKRYYHIIAHLESKGLISVSKVGRSYQIALTEFGLQKAKALGNLNSFSQLADHMREVKRTFGRKSGSYLKNLIYQLF
jgi:chromosome segregation and condensation protein ScpB